VLFLLSVSPLFLTSSSDASLELNKEASRQTIEVSIWRAPVVLFLQSVSPATLSLCLSAIMSQTLTQAVEVPAQTVAVAEVQEGIRVTPATIERIECFMVNRAKKFLVDSVFRIMKFSDDSLMGKFEEALKACCMQGLLDGDNKDLIEKVYEEKVMDGLYTNYKTIFRNRRRVVNSGMQNIAVSK
jgi:hypothetical protein